MADEILTPAIEDEVVVQTIDDVDTGDQLEDGDGDAGDEGDTESVQDEHVDARIQAPEKKKKETFEERQATMRKLTWEKREQERRLEITAQRAEAAIAKLESLNATVANPKPTPESFESQEDYIEAITDWKINQKEIERNIPKPQNNQNAAKETILRDWQYRREKFMAKNTDYNSHEVQVKQVLEYYKNPVIADLLIESEAGPELVQYFGKNTEALEKIARMSPISAAKEIGKIEDKVTAKPVRKKISSAPPPASTTVRGGGASNNGYAGLSAEAFMAKRNAELSRKK